MIICNFITKLPLDLVLFSDHSVITADPMHLMTHSTSSLTVSTSTLMKQDQIWDVYHWFGLRASPSSKQAIFFQTKWMRQFIKLNIRKLKKKHSNLSLSPYQGQFTQTICVLHLKGYHKRFIQCCSSVLYNLCGGPVVWAK